MKKLTALFLFVLIVSVSFAQTKYEKKAEKLFIKGKYEKCIKKTKRFLQKEKKSVNLQYFVVASNLYLYKESTDNKKKYYLKKTITEWEKLDKFNKKNKDYSVLKDSIHTKVIKYISNYENQSKVYYFHNKLAKVFNDTTTYYKERNQKVIIKEPIVFNNPGLSEIRTNIIKNAQHVIGVKYKYGGTDSTGFDCSGFTQYAYKSIGIDIPHNADKQSKLGKTISLEEAKSGDLIFFGSNRAYHAGMIYSNNNGEIKLIHCVSGGVALQETDDENTKYWLQRVLCVKKIIPDE